MLITEELANVVCKHKFEYFMANDGYLEFCKSPSRQRVDENTILFTLKIFYDHGLDHGEYLIEDFDIVCKQVLGLGFGKRSRHRRTEANGRFVEQEQAIYFDIDENTYKVNCTLLKRGDVQYQFNVPKYADDDYICEITKDDLKMARKMRGNLCASDQRVYLRSVKLIKPELERRPQQIVIKGGTLDLLFDGVEKTHTFRTDIKATDELIKMFFSSMLEVEQELCEIDSYVEFEVDPTDLVPSDYKVHVGRFEDTEELACVYFSNGIYEYQKRFTQDYYDRVARKRFAKEDRSGLLAFASRDSDEETTAP